MRTSRRAAVALILLVGLGATTHAQSAREILDRATADFRAGRIAESLSGFDRVIALQPEAAPHLWQRGISLFYAGRFTDCRAQFESHRTVNPADVENAAWHFLCVAAASSLEAARAAMLPVGPDPRVPMQEVERLFRGTASPADVMAAAEGSESARFYAQLYVGLYFVAAGRNDEGRTLIQRAADPRFAPVGGYMHDVARVHLQIRK